MPRRTDSRDRMIETAAELFQRRGYHATGLSELVAKSGAPRGSIYFHFPGGKEELAVAVAALADAGVDEVVAVAAQAPDAAGFLRTVSALIGGRLEASGFHIGCAIATMVLELAPDVEPARAEFDRCFTRWRTGLAAHLEGYGYEAARAAAIAALFVTSLEGALILSRAGRSLEPVEAATEGLIALLSPPG